MRFAHELAQAARSLRRQPGLVVTALATLALAIGFNTTVFSVVENVLLEPLPFPDSDRIVRVRETVPGGDSRDAGLATAATYYAWSEAGESVEEVASYAGGAFSVGTPEGPVGVRGAWVTPSVFPLLRAEALHGRVFDAESARPGLSRITLLGENLWRVRFGADPSAIGRVIEVEGMECRVVGVMPAGFAFPDHEAELWLAFVVPRPEFGTPQGSLAHPTIARLRPGFSISEAAAEATLAALRGHLAEPESGRRVSLIPLLDEVVEGVRPALMVVSAAVLFVLLIGAANLANLFLVRAVRRRRELAVRVTLGAARRDLVRQMLGESLLLGLVGGALGIGLAWLTTRSVPGWLPADFPRLADIELNGAVVAFATGLSVLTGLACGLPPALRAWRVEPLAALNDAPGGGGRLRTARGRLQAAFIVAQVALALVLLVGAGLLLKSFVRLIDVDPGYDPDGVLTARLSLPGLTLPDEERWRRFEEAATGLESLPGVDSVGFGTGLPMSPTVLAVPISLPGSPQRASDRGRADLNVVRPAYARALGLRQACGRFPVETDTEGASPVFVVNEAFVAAYLDAPDPIGMEWPHLLDGKRWQLVGVVRDMRYEGLDAAPAPAVYVSFRQTRSGDRAARHLGVELAVRTRGDLMTLAGELPDRVSRLDAGLAFRAVATMGQRISASIAAPRVYTALLGVIAALALGLACLGIYGVLAYSVAERRRETGVRLALGAQRGDVVRLVYAHGLSLAAAGASIGVLGALVLARYLQSLLFEVEAYDLVTFAGVPLLMLGVASAACAIPAWRASRMDAAENLRVG